MFDLLSRYNFYKGSSLKSEQTISLKIKADSVNSNGSDENEASDPECDQLDVNIEQQNEVLLMKFEELLRSKFNSGIISEDEVFSVELKDLHDSFIEYFDTQNLHNFCVEKLRNDQIKFKELVLAYDHKNVTFEDDLVKICITSDKVEQFEAANRELFKGMHNSSQNIYHFISFLFQKL